MKLILLYVTIVWFVLPPIYVHSSEKWIITDESGETTGEIKPDPLFKDRLRIFDKHGRYKGEIRPDPLFEDRMRIYDSKGFYKGEVKPDPLYRGTTSRSLGNNMERLTLP